MEKEKIMKLYKEAAERSRSKNKEERIKAVETMIDLEEVTEINYGYEFWYELRLLRKEIISKK